MKYVNDSLRGIYVWSLMKLFVKKLDKFQNEMIT
jgi:hypothetical protein